MGEFSLYRGTFYSRLVKQKIIEFYVANEHTNILSPCIWRKIFNNFLSVKFIEKHVHMI
jgi:hypothetical protein